MSGQYLMSSLNDQLQTEILKRVLISSKGPDVLIPIIESVGTYMFEAMELVRQKLQSLSLKNYAGKNVAKLNIELRTLCEQLYAAGYWRNDFLMTLIRKFRETACEEFQQ